MKNLLTKKLHYYFKSVEERKQTADRALNNFLLEFGGQSTFIPIKQYSKKELIEMAYADGIEAKLISRIYEISLNYVYRIITEINGERFRNAHTARGNQ